MTDAITKRRLGAILEHAVEGDPDYWYGVVEPFAGSLWCQLCVTKSEAYKSTRPAIRSSRQTELALEQLPTAAIGCPPRVRLDLDPADVSARHVGLLAQLRDNPLESMACAGIEQG